MNNNPNMNNSFPNGMPNNNTVPNNNIGQVDPTINNNNDVQNPVNSVPVDNNAPNPTPQNDTITLGTVSNVTYADTIGDIDYGPPVDPSTLEPAQSEPENFIANDYNETSLSDLNVEGTYNNMNVAPDYINDPKVMENIHPEKKNTISIGKELKTFLLIGAILLIFILGLPVLLDIFNKIRFH